ncbi:MAG TPA: hypothetical protein VNA04_14315 [Thermoanaerobaculia bacterium]|nr:hypothetical protein [Thermoanaerobaculia bacterium]
MTPNKISLSVAAAILAGSAFVAVPRAGATVALAATFDEKVENAQAIVLGRVVKQETRYDEEKRFILTYTTFRVEKALKGGAPPDLTLVTPGGRVGEVRQTTVGVPVFEEGREHVVFVRDSSRGPTVLFFDQGAYDVVTERGERIVLPVATGAVRLDAQRGVAAAPEQPRTLREFEAAVRAAGERARLHRMQVLEQQRREAEERSSIWTAVARNKWVILLAVLGLIVATIHFMRRT